MKPIYLFLITIPQVFTYPITLRPNTSILSRTEAPTNSEIEPGLPPHVVHHGDDEDLMCGVTIDGQDICVPNTIGNALKGINFDEELTNEVSKATGNFDGVE